MREFSNGHAIADRTVREHATRTAPVRGCVRMVRRAPAARASSCVRHSLVARHRAAGPRRAVIGPRLARNSLIRCPRGAKQFASSSGSLGFRSCGVCRAMPGPRAIRSCLRLDERKRRGSTEG